MSRSEARKTGLPDKGSPGTSGGFRLPAVAFAATAATTASSRFLRAGFVDRQRTTAQLGTIQGRDRGLGLLERGHLDKAEASRLPRELVRDHARRFYSAMHGEQFIQLLLGRRIRQPTHINLRTHRGPPW